MSLLWRKLSMAAKFGVMCVALLIGSTSGYAEAPPEKNVNKVAKSKVKKSLKRNLVESG